MFTLIKWEIKKSLRVGILVVWAFALLLGYITIFTQFGVNETYADLFNKYYGLAPVMGLLMFAIFSGSFILEHSSKVDGLIKASKNGKKQLVLAKFIANGISASMINLSILWIMVVKTILIYKLDGLDLQLKSLWYFGNSDSNITVLQMLFIVSITVILGSFLFSAVGLYMSAISKKAAIPFIFGGLIMGIPYILGARISKEIMINTPLYGMFSQQLIRYDAPINSWVIFVSITLILNVIFYNLTKKRFLKEN